MNPGAVRNQASEEKSDLSISGLVGMNSIAILRWVNRKWGFGGKRIKPTAY